jgi:hypothetical protein
MYMWSGMKKINRQSAIDRVRRNQLVYLLYDDNTESEVIEENEILSHSGEFGIEKRG